MSQLACRFCANAESVHVVDPLVDLRFRFENKQQLRNMLKARRIDVNVDDVELKYRKWWKAYEKMCADLSKEKHDASLKQQMLEESEGLLGALRLPNDLAAETPTEDTAFDICSNNGPPKHMMFLRKAGMVKVNDSISSLHTVGLPTLLHNAIEKIFIQHFTPFAMLVSPPHMVRGAVIEAVNVPKETFLLFSDSSEGISSKYLTGHGLISLLSIFAKCCFTKQSNQWPVRVFSSGASYRNSLIGDTTPNLYEASQRKKLALLSICSDDEEERTEYAVLVNELEGLLLRTLSCPISKNLLSAHKLYNYESLAMSFIYGDSVEMGRVSRSGTYIPNRLNIVHSGKDATIVEFVRLVYAQIDITRCVGMLIEEHLLGTKPIPDIIRQML